MVKMLAAAKNGELQKTEVVKNEDIPDNRNQPKLKKQVNSLRGLKIDHFRYLLKQGYPLKLAFLGASTRPHFKLVATSVGMAAIARLSQKDPWLFRMLHQEAKCNYSYQFWKTFHTLIARGESVEDSLALARRDADTRMVLGTQNGMCDPKSLEGKIRVVICSTSYPEEGIRSEECRTILAELKKAFLKVEDIRDIPYIVECGLVPGKGYILAFCADALTVRWLRLTLESMTLWPKASLFMVREEKFLESCIMTVSIPNCRREKRKNILRQIKIQNHKVKIGEWSVLTTEDLYSCELVKLTMLVPLMDCKEHETTPNLTVQYHQHQLQLVAPEDRTSIGKRASFRGIFGTEDLPTDDVFKILASENEGIAVTDEWKQAHRNGDKVSFFVDAASARAIRAANCELNFLSRKVKVVYQQRVSEV